MCAPMSVGAIEPVGITNASTTNVRKMNASTNSIRIDSIVSLMFVSLLDWLGRACRGEADDPRCADVSAAFSIGTSYVDLAAGAIQRFSACNCMGNALGGTGITAGREV